METAPGIVKDEIIVLEVEANEKRSLICSVIASFIKVRSWSSIYLKSWLGGVASSPK